MTREHRRLTMVCGRCEEEEKGEALALHLCEPCRFWNRYLVGWLGDTPLYSPDLLLDNPELFEGAR